MIKVGILQRRWQGLQICTNLINGGAPSYCYHHLFTPKRHMGVIEREFAVLKFARASSSAFRWAKGDMAFPLH